jgi:hypothetical protein
MADGRHQIANNKGRLVEQSSDLTLGYRLSAIDYWLFERASGEFANPRLLGAGSQPKLNGHAGEMDRGGRLEPGGI